MKRILLMKKLIIGLLLLTSMNSFANITDYISGSTVEAPTHEKLEEKCEKHAETAREAVESIDVAIVLNQIPFNSVATSKVRAFLKSIRSRVVDVTDRYNGYLIGRCIVEGDKIHQ
jgi:hypothetical protein